MEIANKIVIADKSSATIPLKNLVGTLFWKTKVDLDLHCFYETKDGNKGHISYRDMGSLNRAPFISLDKDSGIGGNVASGGNEENLRFGDLTNIKHLIICANIYSARGKWSDHKGNVTVKTDDGKGFEVPLTADLPGDWCVIAHVDNTSPMGAELKNINKVFRDKPGIDGIANDFSGAVTSSGTGASSSRTGFFGGLFR